MTIYGVRYCDREMLRFFSTEEQAREFIAKQDYSPTCYNVVALSDTPVFWDTPRKALCWNEDNNHYRTEEYLIGYVPRSDDGLAISDHTTWPHCALLPEKPEPRKVTNRELAEWLALGNGQVQYKVPGDSDLEGYRVVTSSTWTYKGDDNWALDYENFYGDVWVRRWDDTEWHMPTAEYLNLEDL